ncbi:MAG: hypothetical protein Q9195_005597 [Heterodermia aff. obscurata]
MASSTFFTTWPPLPRFISSKLYFLGAYFYKTGGTSTSAGKAVEWDECSATTTWDDSAATTWDSSETQAPSGWDDSAATTWDSSSNSSTTETQATGWDDSSAATTTWDSSSSSCAVSTWDASAATTWDSSSSSSTLATSTEDPSSTLPFPPPSPPTLRAHHLATTLHHTLSRAAHTHLLTHAPHQLLPLRLPTPDTIDLNAWITLLRHLYEKRVIKLERGKELPVVNRWFEERCKEGEGEELGRLRQVAVHRWGFDAEEMVLAGRRFRAVLGDDDDEDDEEEDDEEEDEEEEEEPYPTTATSQVQFLNYLVHTLERAFHRLATLHPDLVPQQQLPHAHSLELPRLAETCIPALGHRACIPALGDPPACIPALGDRACALDLGDPACVPASGDRACIPALGHRACIPALGEALPDTTVKLILDVCRALRNAAAHHNSFEAEAIQGRRDGGSVVCRYDGEKDPYAAMARDAEMVARVIGDEKAAREVRLAAWVGDICVRRLGERMMRVEEGETRDYLRLARQAERAKRGLKREDMSWEGTFTLYRRYDEAVTAFDQRAAEIIPGAGEIFERWGRDVVGGIVDPRLDTAEAEWTS